MDRPDWDEYFLRMAELVATRSTCPRRRVGAVLVRDERVIATGYNGSLRGQPHCTEAGCLMVDGHCKRTVHAEQNALLQCAYHGARSAGGVLYSTAFPCLDCAKAMVQAGVVRLVYGDPYPDPHSRSLLAAAGVEVAGPPAREAAAALEAGPGRTVGGRRPRCDATAFVAGSAEVDGDVEVGPRAGIWYGAVLRGDIAPISVGAESNLQDGCIVHTDPDHPCIVGRGVTVGHGAVLHGCRVEDGALVGMRATVLTGARVGSGAIVGAGALVREGQEVPAGMLAVGVPARVARPVRPDEAERVRAGTLHYVELAALHRAASGS